MNCLSLLYHKNIIFSRALYIHKEIVCQGDVIFYCIFRKNLIKNRFVTLPRGRRRESASPCKASDSEAASQCFVPDSRIGAPLFVNADFRLWWCFWCLGLRERVGSEAPQKKQKGYRKGTLLNYHIILNINCKDII